MPATCYLAADGFEGELAHDLAAAGAHVELTHGRLFVCAGPVVDTPWAANVWFEPERLGVSSIGDAARQLRDRGRNWAPYTPTLRGRAELIQAKLPYVSAKPLVLGAVAPAAPLGSWTLLDADTVLASSRCSDPFPNGEPRFVETPEPPSRAYLKLWEAFARLGRWPAPGEHTVDLGASPGGWTWTLAACSAHVDAFDKAELDPSLMRNPLVRWRGTSAFAVDPKDYEGIDWLVCDVIAYPGRIRSLVERWQGAARHLVVTVKFQGVTDHEAVRSFRNLPGRLVHLHHNKHELCYLQ